MYASYYLSASPSATHAIQQSHPKPPKLIDVNVPDYTPVPMSMDEANLNTLRWVNKHQPVPDHASNKRDSETLYDTILQPSVPIPLNEIPLKTSVSSKSLSSSTDKSGDDFKDIAAYEVYDEGDFLGELMNGEIDFTLTTLQTNGNPYTDALDKLKRDLDNVANLENEIQHISNENKERSVERSVERNAERNVERNAEQNHDISVETAKAAKKKASKKTKVANKSVLEPCECRRKCKDKIDENRRRSINKQYWELSHERRGDWLLKVVRENSVKRLTVKEENRKVQRSKAYEYFLPTPNRGEDVQVCQKFFLRTLGYTSNKKLLCLFNKTPEQNIASVSDERGRHEPTNKTSDEIINAIDLHIESANPTSSHYRLKHAPLRVYLPSELSATLLHKYFMESNPDMKVKYDIYRQRLRLKNVSFAKLGLEDCEVCIRWKEHVKREIKSEYANDGIDFVIGKLLNNVECAVDGCEICSDFTVHSDDYKTSREEYENDKCVTVPSDSIIATTDMQKVVMLPRMPGVKTCIFTKRLIAYHMTFAPVNGMKQKKGKPVGIIWHSAIRGRNDEDVTSTYIKYIDYVGKKKIKLWVDNCSAQNKNWTLFTALTRVVNDPQYDCDEIILSYFEPGHTYMAADAFHKAVEDGMREAKNVYDFHDFEKIIQQKGIAIKMEVNNFQKFESKLSKAKYTSYPLLDKITVAKFIKGSVNLFWKENMKDESFQSGKFLQKKFVDAMRNRDPFPHHTAPQGFALGKKAVILKKLCPLMPESRTRFWNTVPECPDDEDE